MRRGVDANGPIRPKWRRLRWGGWIYFLGGAGRRELRGSFCEAAVETCDDMGDGVGQVGGRRGKLWVRRG